MELHHCRCPAQCGGALFASGWCLAWGLVTLGLCAAAPEHRILLEVLFHLDYTNCVHLCEQWVHQKQLDSLIRSGLCIPGTRKEGTQSCPNLTAFFMTTVSPKALTTWTIFNFEQSNNAGLYIQLKQILMHERELWGKSVRMFWMYFTEMHFKTFKTLLHWCYRMNWQCFLDCQAVVRTAQSRKTSSVLFVCVS